MFSTPSFCKIKVLVVAPPKIPALNHFLKSEILEESKKIPEEFSGGLLAINIFQSFLSGQKLSSDAALRAWPRLQVYSRARNLLELLSKHRPFLGLLPRQTRKNQ